MELPKKIFKYYPVSKLSFKSLKSQTVYFASPRNFNDPYDCAISVQFIDLTDEELNEMRDFFLKNREMPESTKKVFSNSPKEELKNKFCASVNKILTEYKEDFLNERGVCCFTENNDNLLMWSHYADIYKGFCLEFDTNYEPFNKIEKVVYSKEMPRLNPLERPCK